MRIVGQASEAAAFEQYDRARAVQRVANERLGRVVVLLLGDAPSDEDWALLRACLTDRSHPAWADYSAAAIAAWDVERAFDVWEQHTR